MKLLEFLKKYNIGKPPWRYHHLLNLDPSEYPKYLKKIYKIRTGKTLNLEHPKTFSEKIQRIKLYGITDLMRNCTDKVKVRDFVKEKIGEEYLKPVLQIIPNESKETMRCHCEQVNDNSGLARQSADRCNHILDCHADIKMSSSARLRFPKFQFRENRVLAEYNDKALIYKDNDNENNVVSAYFDQINFDKLPNAFVLKCNHGCKWHCTIKDKEKFLSEKQVFEITKNKITGWLEQEFWVWEGFEMNYKGIKPKILIEPFMPAKRYIEIYCFNGIPQIYSDIQLENEVKICTYNKDFSYSDLILKKDDEKFMCKFSADNILKQAAELSKKLSHDFKFVRVDWFIPNCEIQSNTNSKEKQNNLLFEELTFTPYSGFTLFDEKWNKKLGDFIEL